MISIIMTAVKKITQTIMKYTLTMMCLSFCGHYLVSIKYITEKQFFDNMGWLVLASILINIFILPRFSNFLKLLFVTCCVFPVYFKLIQIGFEEFKIKETTTMLWVAKSLAMGSAWATYQFGSRLIQALFAKIAYVITFPFRWVGSSLKGIYNRIMLRLRGLPPCPINLSMFQVDRLGNGDTYEKGMAFEEFIAQMYRILGYNAKTTTQLRKEGKLPPSIQKRGGSGEQGVDVVYTMTMDGQIKKTIIQCKHYSNKVDNKAIQEIVAAKNLYGADHLVVITNNYFTKPARELAESNGVTLIDRDLLPKVIRNVTQHYYKQKDNNKKNQNEKKINKKKDPKEIIDDQVIEPTVDFDYMNSKKNSELLD